MNTITQSPTPIGRIPTQLNALNDGHSTFFGLLVSILAIALIKIHYRTRK